MGLEGGSYFKEVRPNKLVFRENPPWEAVEATNELGEGVKSLLLFNLFFFFSFSISKDSKFFFCVNHCLLEQNRRETKVK